MQQFLQNIIKLDIPSFTAIRKIANREIIALSENESKKLHDELDRGIAILDSHLHLCQYLYSFGKMHQAKLFDAFNNLPKSFFHEEFEVIDWGCGQAMGTINLFDFLRPLHLTNNIRKITLIEPSKAALERAELFVSRCISGGPTELSLINGFFEDVTSDQIRSRDGRPVLHIFSNILDVKGIDLKHLSMLIDTSIVSDNILLTVGPLNPNNHLLDNFLRYFESSTLESIYEFETYGFIHPKWTYKARVYKLEPNEVGHLIPIEYFPTVQFQACYELDVVKELRKEHLLQFDPRYSHFEVAAPFDLGASIYEDVEPLLAVLNNIITRGLPTKASLYLEEFFSKSFGLSTKSERYGEISYTTLSQLDGTRFFNLFDTYLDQAESKFSAEEVVQIQLLFTPIAIARFQKMLVEAIITGRLSLNQEKWTIVVEEKDVPFAYMALEDFKQLFFHLSRLSEQYEKVCLPEIDLFVINGTVFKDSPLQGETKVFSKVSSGLAEMSFNLVVTQAIFKSNSNEIESFSKFKAKNNCYFNIRTISEVRTERSVYTSELIKYKPVVTKTPQGQLIELEEQKAHLSYFLQLFFRKESFREGQLPILDRAIQNLPVIGLLPTGGGKSLTYQIAALLQPGVTMIIDPLKSLMKDQLDGLINGGVDCAAFINSSQTGIERKETEKRLESSQLLFIFLSPERLSIASFRERLKSMHSYNVYFSYGVIDEVHCVSEWGHDFRFSYLHLGRNLYNYVRAKSGEISLFGLTATASFDVLADVERELSGNGAFILDADVIVRSENATRLELQYKIEKVHINFAPDQYYDKNNKIDAHLPRALNISDSRTAFDSKAAFLKDYLKRVRAYLSEVQAEEYLQEIKKQFAERQNTEELPSQDLSIELSSDFFDEKPKYKEAGIVFCPHVNTTGISVNKNFEILKNANYAKVVSFSGKDTDDSSMGNLEKFRENESPLMIATKAFGMGIDKPNVRFTINLNFSSSLEAFVQEAGRAGRDRKMALAVIFLSDYDLATISKNYPQGQFPLGIIKNKWFHRNDLKKILNHYRLSIPEEYFIRANPSNDIVKLHCIKDNKMFAFKECSTACTEFKRCQLKDAGDDLRGWKPELELTQELEASGLKVSRKNFQYLNPDFQTIMYFFNESFKGDIIEKKNMVQLLNSSKVYLEDGTEKTGFISSVLEAEIGTNLTIYVPYTEESYADLSKAIYRMCCIELIADFTQDYKESKFRIVSTRKEGTEYYEGLQRFLRRYYTVERSKLEIAKVKSIVLPDHDLEPIRAEIYRCLSFLTEFVYDKISEKRKRAMDDMRNFSVEGIQPGISWINANEKLKDNLFYYFNSKFAREDYVADNGEDFSLTMDTDYGKESNSDILFKYLRVIDDEIVGVGTPLDNVKHLYGAVRLISRSLTDHNPALYLLEVFCLAYMGTRKNENLENQLKLRYNEGMVEFSKRYTNQTAFWNLFYTYNEIIIIFLEDQKLSSVINEMELIIHRNRLEVIKEKFLEGYGQ